MLPLVVGPEVVVVDRLVMGIGPRPDHLVVHLVIEHNLVGSKQVPSSMSDRYGQSMSQEKGVLVRTRGNAVGVRRQITA